MFSLMTRAGKTEWYTDVSVESLTHFVAVKQPDLAVTVSRIGACTVQNCGRSL